MRYSWKIEVLIHCEKVGVCFDTILNTVLLSEINVSTQLILKQAALKFIIVSLRNGRGGEFLPTDFDFDSIVDESVEIQVSESIIM